MEPHPPSHGLKTESVPSMKPEEKNKTDLLTSSKWQIGLLLCLKPFLGGSSACAAGGMIMPPRGSTQRGCPPLGDSLVTFSSGRKSPGAPSMARPCSRGAPASGGVGAASFTKSSQGAEHGKAMLSRSARIVGAGTLVPAKKKGGPAGPQKIFFIRAARKCRPTPARCAPPARG